MAKRLTRLRVDEISSVDRGAGEGVKIMLMKRDDTSNFGKKRDNNMSTIAKLFSKVFGGGNGNDIIIDKSLEGLAESVTSILADDNVDQGAALTETFEQFGDHLKSTLTAGPAVAKKEGSEMDLKALAKALGLAETATEAEVTTAIGKSLVLNAQAAVEIKKLQVENKIAKADFTPQELDHYQKAFPPGDDDEDDSDGKNKAKKAFRLASHADRAVTMKSAEPALPAHIQKIMDDNAAMAKRLAELEAGGSLVALTKQATEIGLAEAEGATIQKALSGDKDAVGKLLGFIKAATEQAKLGGVFKEFGSSAGTGVVTTAYDELTALAKNLQKADPKLDFSKAFAKVYEDPANADVVKRERGENRPAAA